MKDDKTDSEPDKNRAKIPIIATICSDGDIIALSEPRLTGKHVISAHGFKMFFSGGSSKHEHGVSLWVKQTLPHTVEYVDPVSDRILVVAGVFNDVTLAMFRSCLWTRTNR